MTEHDFLVALREFWITSWVEAVSEVPFVWADDTEPAQLENLHLRLTVRNEGGVRRGIGRAREESRGLISVEVRSPQKDGPGHGERLASLVAAVWRSFRHVRIQLTAPSVVGLTADGAFNRHLVTLGWRGDMRLAQ